MKTKLNITGILPLVCVLFAALALVCVSCTGSYIDSDTIGGSGSSVNPFVGSWSGNVTSSGQTIPATCDITDTTLDFKVPSYPSYNRQGTYKRNGNSASFDIDGTAGTATVSGNTLTISSGSMVGTFTK
jgi:hypothetical protein